MKLSNIAAAVAFTTSIGPSLSAPLTLPYRVLHQFALGTWVENLYVRANGDLLVTTLLPNASLYQVSDPTSSSPRVNLVHTFNEVNGLLGIVETTPDVFITFGGNFSSPGAAINGTFHVFELDFSHSTPSFKRTIRIPEAEFLNGVQALPRDPRTILIADSTRGLVWRLNTATGEYKIGIQVPEMEVASGAPFLIGVNGLRIHKEYLYWTNSFAATIYRLKIDSRGFAVVARLDEPFLDDLTSGPLNEDTLWVATNLGDSVAAVRKNGKSIVVDGSEEQLSFAGATATAFGRKAVDKDILYVTTSGGLASPINGTEVEGGKIIAVDVKHFL